MPAVNAALKLLKLRWINRLSLYYDQGVGLVRSRTRLLFHALFSQCRCHSLSYLLDDLQGSRGECRVVTGVCKARLPNL